MGGDNSQTTTTGLNNEALSGALTKIGTQLGNQVDRGTALFDAPMYPGISDTTRGGVAALTSAAGNTGGLTQGNNWLRNVVDAGGYNGALTEAAQGVRGFLAESQADAPGYAALRAQAGDDTLRDVNSMFTSSGRFGSGSHVDTATESLGNVYAGMDMQNYENRLGRQMAGNQALAGIGQTAFGNAAGAAGMLPSFYQAGLMPGQAQLAAGQVLDADMLARRQSDADYYDRTHNSGWQNLARAGSILSGTAGAAGTTTTQTQNTPWWQTGLGIGAGLLSFL